MRLENLQETVWYKMRDYLFDIHSIESWSGQLNFRVEYDPNKMEENSGFHRSLKKGATK